MQLAMNGAGPKDKINPSANWPQRDLLLLPYATFAIEDLPEASQGFTGFNYRLAAREMWTMLMVSLLKHEYCQGSRSGCERPKDVPVIAIQYQALVRLTTAAEMMFQHCHSEIGSKRLGK